MEILWEFLFYLFIHIFKIPDYFAEKKIFLNFSFIHTFWFLFILIHFNTVRARTAQTLYTERTEGRWGGGGA